MLTCHGGADYRRDRQAEVHQSEIRAARPMGSLRRVNSQRRRRSPYGAVNLRRPLRPLRRPIAPAGREAPNARAAKQKKREGFTNTVL